MVGQVGSVLGRAHSLLFSYTSSFRICSYNAQCAWCHTLWCSTALSVPCPFLCCRSLYSMGCGCTMFSACWDVRIQMVSPGSLRPHQPPPLSVPSLWLCGVPWGHCFQNPRQEANPSPICVQTPNLTGVPVTLHFTTDFVEVLGTRLLLVSLIFLLDYSLPQPSDNLDISGAEKQLTLKVLCQVSLQYNRMKYLRKTS